MADATYAVVDLAKKKRDRSEKEPTESTAASENAFPLYAEVERSGSGEEIIDSAEYSKLARDFIVDTKASALAIKSDNIPGKRSNESLSRSRMQFACILFTIAVVAIITLICLAVIFIELASLKTQTASLQQMPQLSMVMSSSILQLQRNVSSIEDKIEMQESRFMLAIQYLEMTNKQLDQRINTSSVDISHLLSTLPTLQNQTRQLSTNVEMFSVELKNETDMLRNRLEMLVPYSFEFPAVSCATLNPSSPSGYYWVRASNGSAVRVYCDMTRSCGGMTGGWMRVAELDMTNSSHQCSSGFTEHNTTIRTCRRTDTSRGCSSIMIDINIIYSNVCGRVRAYQVGTTNAFASVGGSNDIDSDYVDGVSLTHGNPRQHVWTFAAGLDKNQTINPASKCPCNNPQATAPPPFVGEDYFCEAGISLYTSGVGVLVYFNDPLWDGEGCGTSNTCCSFNNPPWFYKQLPQPTTDDIEMRVCRDEVSSNEDVAIEIVELYVR